jgi:hypothetical protein
MLTLTLANATTRKVGIGTSNPRYNLEVRGGIGATDVIISGIATVLNELRVGTAGTIFTVIAGPTGDSSISWCWYCKSRISIRHSITSFYRTGSTLCER